MASWHLNKKHKERISNKLSMAKILKQTWKIININIVKQNQTTCEKWLINKNKFFVLIWVWDAYAYSTMCTHG